MKPFNDCRRLDTFHVFYSYDSQEDEDEDEIEFTAEGLPIYEHEIVQIVGLWEPDADNRPGDVEEFIEAGHMLLSQAGDEWTEHDDTYIHGTVLIRGAWRRLYLITVSLLETAH